MSALPDDVSLHGVLDTGRVEVILRSFCAKLKEQDEKITALQNSLANSASSDSLDTIRGGVDRALEAIEKRFAALESRFQRVESCHPRVSSAERSLEILERAVQGKADIMALEQTRFESHKALGDTAKRLEAQMSDAETVIRLEGGQRQLAKQLSAVQELLSCKIDRVEIPLLQSAGERVKAADEFRVEAGPRLDAMERELNDVRSDLNAKEEKSAIVERMQAIYTELQNRVELEWAQEKLETPLDEIRKRVEVLQCDISLLQPQNVAETLHELRDGIRKVHMKQESRERKIESLEGMLKSRASVRLVDKKADRTYCEQLVHEVSLTNEQRLRQSDKSMEDLGRQILQLKRVQSNVDKKLAVSMRFLDWFSSVSLDKGSPPGF